MDRFAQGLLLGICFLAGCESKPPLSSPSHLGSLPDSPSPRGARGSQSEQAIREIDEQLKLHPEDVNLLKEKAIHLQSQAGEMTQSGASRERYDKYEQSAELWRKVKSGSQELTTQDADAYATAIYNQACALSLRDEREAAIAALRESLEAGFSNLYLLKTDQDLDRLRELAAFKTLLEEAPQFRIAAMKKHVSERSLFPFDFHLTNLKGEKISSRDFQGKVLVLVFWATWSRDCRRQISDLAALRRKHGEQSVAIVGVNYEEAVGAEESRKVVVDFAAQQNIPFDCTMGDAKTTDQIPFFQGYPTLLLIDRAGRVRAKLDGYYAVDDLDALATLLLNEPPFNEAPPQASRVGQSP